MTTPDPEQKARAVLARNVEKITGDGRGDIIRNVPDADLSWMQRACIAAMLEYAALTTPTPRQEEAVAVPAGMVRTDGSGWVFLNVDTGEEYSPCHPKRSGEVPDAQRVRRSTEQEDVLWSAFQREFERAHALETQLSTPLATPDTAPLSGQVAPAAGDGTSASDRNHTETSGSERFRSGVTDFAATPPVIAPGEEPCDKPD